MTTQYRFVGVSRDGPDSTAQNPVQSDVRDRSVQRHAALGTEFTYRKQNHANAMTVTKATIAKKRVSRANTDRGVHSAVVLVTVIT